MRKFWKQSLCALLMLCMIMTMAGCAVNWKVYSDAQTTDEWSLKKMPISGYLTFDLAGDNTETGLVSIITYSEGKSFSDLNDDCTVDLNAVEGYPATLELVVGAESHDCELSVAGFSIGESMEESFISMKAAYSGLSPATSYKRVFSGYVGIVDSNNELVCTISLADAMTNDSSLASSMTWDYLVGSNPDTIKATFKNNDSTEVTNVATLTLSANEMTYTGASCNYTATDIFSGMNTAFRSFNAATGQNLSTDDITLYATNAEGNKIDEPISNITGEGTYIAEMDIPEDYAFYTSADGAISATKMLKSEPTLFVYDDLYYVAYSKFAPETCNSTYEDAEAFIEFLNEECVDGRNDWFLLESGQMAYNWWLATDSSNANAGATNLLGTEQIWTAEYEDGPHASENNAFIWSLSSAYAAAQQGKTSDQVITAATQQTATNTYTSRLGVVAVHMNSVGMAYEEPEKVTCTFRVNKAHVHGSWVYSVNGATLTATCGAAKCTSPATKVSLTISAKSPITSGSTIGWCNASKVGFTISGTSAWKSMFGNSSVPTIHYDGVTDSGTNYSSNTKPTANGTYTASISAGGKKAAISFKIGLPHSGGKSGGTEKPVCAKCGASYGYLLKYDVNGGNALSQTTKGLKPSETYGTLPSATRTGYSLLGWYTAKTDGTKVSSTTVCKKDTTIYAHWKAKKYTLTYNVNGGNKLDTTTKSVTYDKKYGTLATPTRTGYKFAGWYTTKTGGTKVTENTVCKGNKTIYAHWTAKKYTLTYKVNGGDKLSKTTKSVTYDKKYGTLTTPTRKGYKFLGWYTKKSGGTKITASTICKGDQTVYAHWKKNK